LATLKHGARLDEILDQYYEVLKLEESRRLFLANFAQALASSVKQEVTIDPPPPLKEGQGNVEVNGKEVMDGAENTTRERTKHTAYDAWVDRESRLDTYLRSGLYVDYGQLIITNDYVEGKYDKEDNPYAGLPVQALISPTEGFIVQGTPGSQSPDEKDENGNLLYPWPLYTNIQIVDEVVSVLKLMALAQVRNRRGTTQYHTTCGEEFKPYPIPSLQLTSLFYHPAIPEELKTLFQPIADEFEIKLNFVYPETAEELELFKKEYLPSQESLDGAVLMNSVLGTNTDPETADKIMSALLGAGTLTNNTLEGLTNLGLSDEDKVTGLADLVLKDDYSIFDKIEDGLGDRIKEVVDPILSNRASADTGESSSEDDNSTEVATTD